jgi:hypothetical protein
MPPLSLLSTVTRGELEAVEAVVALLNRQRQQQADEMMAAFEAAEASRERYYYSRPPDVPKQLDVDDETMRYWALIARELSVRLDSRTETQCRRSLNFGRCFCTGLGVRAVCGATATTLCGTC